MRIPVTAEIKAGVVDNPDIKSVVMCGIETHACIHHTTLELMEAGKDVHIVVDCCSSRCGHCAWLSRSLFFSLLNIQP